MRKIIQLTESDLQNIVTESVKRILTENDDNSNNPENLPRLAELGDGEYEGTIWGNRFNFENKDYYSEIGAFNIFPSPATAVVENGEVRRFKDNKEYQMPPVTVLGDGTYDGTLKAHCFNYNGKDYWSETGIRTMIPQPWTVTIKNGKVVK